MTDPNETIQQLLYNPTTLPRLIRIVINWNEIPTYLITKGITDALRPRLEHITSNDEIIELEKKINSLMESNSNDGEGVGVGTEIILFVKDDTVYFNERNCANEITFTEHKKIQHEHFCLALCDVYYGNDPVSANHKENVIDGIMSLLR